MARKTDDKVILEMLKEGKSQKEIAEHFGVSAAAISKRVKKFLKKPLPESLTKLTDKQQKFVLERANGKTKTDAALASYDCSTRASAKAIGIELERKNDIQVAMQDALQEVGLTRRYRAFKTLEHVDNPDPNVSLKALDQANKIDGAYAPEKHINLNVDYRELTKNLEEVQREKAEHLWELKKGYIEDLRAEFPSASPKKLEEMARKAISALSPQEEEEDCIA